MSGLTRTTSMPDLTKLDTIQIHSKELQIKPEELVIKKKTESCAKKALSFVTAPFKCGYKAAAFVVTSIGSGISKAVFAVKRCFGVRASENDMFNALKNRSEKPTGSIQEI